MLLYSYLYSYMSSLILDAAWLYVLIFNLAALLQCDSLVYRQSLCS